MSVIDKEYERLVDQLVSYVRRSGRKNRNMSRWMMSATVDGRGVLEDNPHYRYFPPCPRLEEDRQRALWAGVRPRGLQTPCS